MCSIPGRSLGQSYFCVRSVLILREIECHHLLEHEDGVELPALESDNMIAVTNSNWRQGRQLLRQYLQEIGYTGQ